MSGGNAFRRFTMRSVKKLDLELTLQCLLRNLKLCPRDLVMYWRIKLDSACMDKAGDYGEPPW